MHSQDIERFWSKAKRAPNGCLEWSGGKFDSGYGVFRLGGKNKRTHRVAWFLAHGEIPLGLMVCHKCDNPACVDPEHLFLGDAEANNKDMIAKGRYKQGHRLNQPKGEKHHKAILNEQSVLRIRILGRAAKQEEMAEWFKVSKQTISAVLRREIWKGIEPLSSIKGLA